MLSMKEAGSSEKRRVSDARRMARVVCNGCGDVNASHDMRLSAK